MSQIVPDFSSGQRAGAPLVVEGPPSVDLGRSPRRGRPRRSRPRAWLVLAFVVLVVGTAGAGYAWTTGSKPAAPSYLAAAASGTVLRDACVDSSKSVDADGQLASRAAGTVAAAVAARGKALASPLGTGAIAPERAVRITGRVVRKDSYETDGTEGYVSRLDVPAAPGLTEAKPSSTVDVDAAARWSDAQATVAAARTTAAAAMDQAASGLRIVLHRPSNGSDVTGCVGAALEASGTGTAPSVLVVSDVEDRALQNSDGTSRSFKGDWSKASVVLVLACPSGVQARCDANARAFTSRMARLGVTRVTLYRPEQLDDAVTAWLAHT